MNSVDFMRGKLEAMKEINEIVGDKLQHAESYKIAKILHDMSVEIGVIWSCYIKDFEKSMKDERANYVSTLR